MVSNTIHYMMHMLNAHLEAIQSVSQLPYVLYLFSIIIQVRSH